MKKVIILILFIFITLPCFSEEVINLRKQRNEAASKILYEHELSKVLLPQEEVYGVFGYKLLDVYAVYYDLNSDGIDEIIGFVDAPYSWSFDGFALHILQKQEGKYEDICFINTSIEMKVPILDTKTNGFCDIRVFPGKTPVIRIAKYNQEYKQYEYFFPN